MQPYVEFLTVMGKLLGMMIGVVGGMTLFTVVFLDVWIKRASDGHIWCFFWSNRQWVPKLLKEDSSEHCVWIGAGEVRERYNLRDGKQGWARWPLMVPKILQVPIRTYEFFRNSSEPLPIEGDPTTGEPKEPIIVGEPRDIDFENGNGTMTARVNNYVTDETMMKLTWKDTREGLGLPTRRLPSKGQAIMLILLIVAVALSGVSFLMNLQTTQALKGLPELSQLLRQLFPAP